MFSLFIGINCNKLNCIIFDFIHLHLRLQNCEFLRLGILRLHALPNLKMNLPGAHILFCSSVCLQRKYRIRAVKLGHKWTSPRNNLYKVEHKIAFIIHFNQAHQP